jgi:hypothetical protein
VLKVRNLAEHPFAADDGIVQTASVRYRGYRPDRGMLVELTGFEPAAFSLRNKRSKRSDLGVWLRDLLVCRICATRVVRRRETW